MKYAESILRVDRLPGWRAVLRGPCGGRYVAAGSTHPIGRLRIATIMTYYARRPGDKFFMIQGNIRSWCDPLCRESRIRRHGWDIYKNAAAL